jgi:succinate dehydrogenase / fumarate reductase cytochrome b subunit
MSWLVTTLGSSLGRKLLMALTGLFLCSFLVIHLSGNLLLLKDDGGIAFNEYANFMAHNPLIETVSILLYASIALHTVVAILLTIHNRKSRPVGYAVVNNQSTWASRSMMLLGTMLLFFILVHMSDFWWGYKIKAEIPNIYDAVIAKFKHPLWMSFYVLSQLVLGFHLSHGFQSAFQTFGFNHKKYTPFIKFVGLAFSIIIPLGFAFLPLYVFFTK